MKQLVDIILASGSPRRKELLEQVGLKFKVLVTDADETTDITDPAKVVKELSRRKAEAALAEYIKSPDNSDQGVLVVSADTVVALNGQVIGKPKDEDDALEILMSLSGQTHDVYTGVSCIYIIDGNVGKTITFSVRTGVKMYRFDEAEARDYIATGEPMDKAGAYGIQGIGARLVERIDGDYNNVVGFPLAAFMRNNIGKLYIFE